MADNYREETTTRKRGRSASKLSVRLFLLDPDKNIEKVTKDIGSERGLNELKQKGYGPPPKGKYSWLIDPEDVKNSSNNVFAVRKRSNRVYTGYQRIFKNILVQLCHHCSHSVSICSRIVCFSVLIVSPPLNTHEIIFL